MKRSAITVILLSVSLVCLAQGAKPSKAQIKKDLVGQEFSDPSANSYFGEKDTWTIRQQDIRAITVVKDTISNGKYTAQAIIHLQKKGFLADAFSIIQYTKDSGKWSFNKIRVRSLSIPRQRDHVDCIELFEDMSFFPTLMAKNNSRDTLLVGFDLENKSGTQHMALVIAPRESKPVCVFIPNNYKATFAYLFDSDYDMFNSFASEPAYHSNDYNAIVFDGIFFPGGSRSGAFTLTVWQIGDEANPYLAYFGCGDECIQLSGHITQEPDGTKSLNLYSHETVLAIHIPMNGSDDLACYPFIQCGISSGREYESTVIYRPELLE